MKKRFILVVLLFTALLFCSTPAHADVNGPALLSSTVMVAFPDSITFNVSARSDVNITDIRLQYTVERKEESRVVGESVLIFKPAPRVDTQYVWDMKKTGGLPPGTGVDYWWLITDAAGKTFKSAPERLQANDTRFAWNHIDSGNITLFWYRGDDVFAGKLMDAAKAALKQLAASTGASPDKHISFYIYANSADLQSSMIYPQDWTGGVTYAQYNVIAIGIAPADLAWGKETIAHELTHLVIHQITDNPYNSLPTWLDEGLAMYSQGPLDLQFTSVLSDARRKDDYISVRSLASPFSAFTASSLLAYAESREVVNYLINTYGEAKMFDLLNVFRQGSGYDDALKKVYGFDMDGLNAQWRATLVPAVVYVFPPVLGGLLAGLGAAVVLILGLYAEEKTFRRS